MNVADNIWHVAICSLQLDLLGAVESRQQCQGAFTAKGAS